MNFILFLLVLAILVIAFLVYRSRVNHVSLKAEKDADLAALKALLLKERDALKADLAELRAKMPGNHHWADAPTAPGVAPTPVPPAAPLAAPSVPTS